MRYRTYTLRIECSDGAALGADDQDALAAGLSDAEDVVNDRLPDGFYCKIDGPTGEGVDMGAVARLEALDNDRDVREHQLRERLGEDEYEYLRMERKIDAAEERGE